MRACVGLLILSLGCGNSSTADAGTDSAIPKATCSPGCGASEVCKQPGACMFDAVCIARSSVTCPEAGLCSTTGCAGELDGSVLQCVCR